MAAFRSISVLIGLAFLSTIGCTGGEPRSVQNDESSTSNQSHSAQAEETNGDFDSNGADSTVASDSTDPDVMGSPQEDSRRSHKDIIQMAGNSVVYIVIRDALGDEIASGTGFVIDERGHIATNFHVVSTAVTAIAQTREGEKMDITGVLAYDPDNDMAILTVNELTPGLVPLPLSIPQIEQGDSVTAVGHPSGFQYTATNGIVSAVRLTSELP